MYLSFFFLLYHTTFILRVIFILQGVLKRCNSLMFKKLFCVTSAEASTYKCAVSFFYEWLYTESRNSFSHERKRTNLFNICVVLSWVGAHVPGQLMCSTGICSSSIIVWTWLWDCSGALKPDANTPMHVLLSRWRVFFVMNSLVSCRDRI